MATKVVRPSDANGNDILWSRAYNYKYQNPNSKTYLTFMRAAKISYGSHNNITFIVCGLDNYANANTGVYLFEVSLRTNATTYCKVKAISAANNTPEFGYYDGGDGYMYYGLKRTSSYPEVPAFTILNNYNSGSKFEFGDFREDDTAPTGWTTITIDA